MRSNAPSRTAVRALVTSAVVLASFDVMLWHAMLVGDQSSAREGAAVSAPIPLVRGASATDALTEVGLPVRIRIPSIAVDAEIEGVSLTKDGAMDVPKRLHDAGWYSHGPRPGEKGSAVLAGHLDGKDGSEAVFANLRDVRPGDRIFVMDDGGIVIQFVVRESRKYDADADAMGVFTSQDGNAHLNLVTCDGPWDDDSGQYAERLVVFADRITD